VGSSLRILHLEDNRNDAELVQAMLASDSIACELVRVETRNQFLAAMNQGGFDLILCDYSMPSFDGRTALALAKEKCPDLPFLFVSGTIGEERAVEALKNGATDYILKDRLGRLAPAVRRALDEAQERTQRKRAEEQIHRLAYYDPLTGLPNRVLLQDHLSQTLRNCHRDNTSVALLLMNLDRFRDINDTLGHQNGDCLLKEVALRLRSALEESTKISRLGGDEFAVLLRADAKGAILFAQTLLKALDDPFVLEGLPVDVRASLGIALFPEHGADPDTLLRRANVALHLAKGTGSGFAVYTSEQDHYDPERLALMGELRQGMASGQLVLNYQPVINLKTGQVIGVEVLMRWQHPQRGLISPAQFIPLAELTGLIKPMTLGTIEAAVRQCQAWKRGGLNLTVSVNLSVRTLQDARLPDQIAKLLDASGVAPGRLGLEITESCIMGDPERAMEILTCLNRMGLKLSVDDFGTGYSSLAYLKRLPVHELKIDKAFVLGMMRDRHDAAIVRAAVDMGHDLGLAVVAEGVEDQQTWHGLGAIGCDAAQGYYMSRPVPAADLPRWLSESHRWSALIHMEGR
jgi:diguanylate cyclase (GGDEF)-like protein